jgi:hypothetical protein
LFGTAANLSATILIGTSYQWVNPNAIFNSGNGVITESHFRLMQNQPQQKKPTLFFSVTNADLQILYDTIHVNVRPLLSLNAGHDTTTVKKPAVTIECTTF